VFVAVEKDEVVGFAVVSVDQSSATGEVQFLGVREDQRGQGYGKQLLLSATNWLLDKTNVPKIALNVADDLANARGLYESVGFTLKFTGVGLRKTLKTR
jgi:ribosomal protein S18 acetylase RimI-like enzyme